MNYFDQKFFLKYLREGEELLFVCHRHVILIIDRIIVMLFFGLILPGFFYYNNSFSLQTLIPFYFFETYVFFLYFYLLYTVFDWYNDVWLVTDLWLVDIDWKIFARNIVYVEYNDVRWTEIQTNSFFDSFLNKWDIIVHTVWWEEDFLLPGAANPYDISSYINEVVERIEKHREEKHKAPFELLLHTLTEMVRQHLEGTDANEDDVLTREEIEKTLQKKGTIDLRSDSR